MIETVAEASVVASGAGSPMRPGLELAENRTALQPILNPDSRRPGKLAHIVGHDDQPFAARMGAGLHVMRTARRSRPFQFGPNLSVMGRAISPNRNTFVSGRLSARW